MPVARPAPQGAPAATAQRTPELGFLPLQVAANAPREESIRVEIKRGAVTMTIVWPATTAADCAAWMREFLR
jgi:transposase